MDSFFLALSVAWGSLAMPFDFDRAPINYASGPVNDVVAPLIAKLRSGNLKLQDDLQHGYLIDILKELQVPQSSQVLVFSKTSLQRQRISPRTPRAIYFNDEVTVGFCLRGDVLEVAAADPNLGTVFYTVDQHGVPQGTIFKRQTESCLVCHGSSSNQGFPGHLIRSVSADQTGELVLSRGTRRVDHTTPLAERWGGWYVTGNSGSQKHLGNRIVSGRNGADETQDASNLTNLEPIVSLGRYLTPHSDIVALMVLEHQAEAHNRLIRANYLTRLALVEQAEINAMLGEKTDTRSEGITRRIERACEPVVQCLLFSEEARLTDRVTGTSSFTKEFMSRGPFDAKGRSLREFDLEKRMFRYPLSYVIYSRLFDGLPAESKARIYRRLYEVLTGADKSKEFEHLSALDRKAILEIMRGTKKDLPAYWKS